MTQSSLATQHEAVNISDLADEVSDLSQRLSALFEASAAHAVFERTLDSLITQALTLASQMQRALAQPEHAQELHASAVELIEGLHRLAGTADKELHSPQTGSHPRNTTGQAEQILRLLSAELTLLSQAGIEPAPRIWRQTYRIFNLIQGLNDFTNTPAQTLRAFKRLLTIATTEPRSLTSAEIHWVIEYIDPLADLLHLQTTPPNTTDGAWYWIDPCSLQEPQPTKRVKPPEDRPLLYISTAALSRKADDTLRKKDHPLLHTGKHPSVVADGLLTQLRQRWHTPSSRQQPRRSREYTVDACIGLTAIWNTLHAPDAAAEAITTWKVINESPGGYAILELEGRSRALMPGIAVALRRHAAEDWSICLIRWLRSDAADRTELGLQVVAQKAIPVKVSFKGHTNPSELAHALVLPVMPALRQHQAVLAPAGTYASRKFTLVSDVDRLYVAQCRLITLDVQTSGLEIFQFDIDPYPL